MPEAENTGVGDTMRGVVAGAQLFGRFTLQKVLGCGGMSVVWLAYEDRLDRLVALKLVPESACFNPAACEDLKRETRKSLLLNHANIVRIFDFIADQGMAAICMEYVDGVPLSHARRQKRSRCFGIPEVVPWITSLCDALTYAHETAGMTHRGLGPANMMLDSRAHLKITDFRIAASLRDSLSRGNLCVPAETLHYMSPQQMLGHDPSPADDIYSLGATLYEMLSSKPLFYGGDVVSQAQEVIAPPDQSTPGDTGNRGRANSEALGGNDCRLSGETPGATAPERSRGGEPVATGWNRSSDGRPGYRPAGFPALRQARRAGRHPGRASRCRRRSSLQLNVTTHGRSLGDQESVSGAVCDRGADEKDSGSGKSRDAAKCHAGIGNNPAGRKFRDLSWTGRKRDRASDRTAAQRCRA